MPDLATFQLAFATAVGRGRSRGALESQPGFAVYRNTTPNALIDVLRANYPVTVQIVGDEAFDALAFEFACLHPPADPVLLGYGQAFADFIDGQPWIADLPYLSDVARLDRLFTESHRAAEAEALTACDLAALGAEGWMGLRLPLHPAARFLWLRSPAMTIWQAHRAERGFDRLAPEWRAEGALLTRPAGAVEAAQIDAAGHRLLFGLRLGERVGEAATALAKVYPEADFPLLFLSLLNRGAFAKPPQLQRTE
jgi:hypothetical protein